MRSDILRDLPQEEIEATKGRPGQHLAPELHEGQITMAEAHLAFAFQEDFCQGSGVPDMKDVQNKQHKLGMLRTKLNVPMALLNGSVEVRPGCLQDLLDVSEVHRREMPPRSRLWFDASVNDLAFALSQEEPWPRRPRILDKWRRRHRPAELEGDCCAACRSTMDLPMNTRRQGDQQKLVV